MNFIEKLFKIDQELGPEEVEGLKFLCRDLLSAKKLMAVNSGQDLFKLLIDTDLIHENDDFLLAELLFILRQHLLLKYLNTNRTKVEEELRIRGKVSLYRRMLFNLSENITVQNLKEILFLLGDKIPKKLAEKMSALDMLCHLEKIGKISDDNLVVLENVFDRVSPDLRKTITIYEAEKVAQLRQETEPCNKLPCVASSYEDRLQLPVSIQVTNPDNMEHSYDDMESIVEHVQNVQGDAEQADDKASSENAECLISGLTIGDNVDTHKKTTSENNFYPMNQKHRGYCLIINNVNFVKNKIREGTQKDAEDLERVLTWLGLEVKTLHNQDKDNIHNILVEYRNKDHTDRDCFICCILTHGESGAIMGSDDQILLIHEMMSLFTATRCPSLVKKPKLFFIQACQGKPTQKGYPIETDAIADDHHITQTIPDDADFLLGMSTVNGYASLRHVREGAWYIQALCKNLVEMVPRQEDILSILTKVNKDVSRMEDPKEGRKQMPQPAYTLTKKLIFPVPQDPFPHKLSTSQCESRV
ncbi:caspase-10 [Bombina bombina]|uniref:caspase-10 n=1 Tax=Bombina bombina TaxID=8345 RepID=UPI00235B2FC4|nr:caspase-10 [Bombina bombina]